MDSIRERILNCVNGYNGLVIKGIPTPIDSPRSRLVIVDAEDMEKLLEIRRPQIAYLQTSFFDFQSEVEEVISYLDNDAIDSLASQWTKYENMLSSLTVSVLDSEILHILNVEAPWHEEFNGMIENLKESIPDEPIGIEEREELEEIRCRGEELSKHPMFIAPKATKSKRKFLADKLFPNTPSNKLDLIVEAAENILWYQTSDQE